MNTQGLATGTAHDMSNKGAPSRPGLAPSPHQQGNVEQQQQQQPPQGMIIQQQYLIQQQRGAVSSDLGYFSIYQKETLENLNLASKGAKLFFWSVWSV